MFTETSERSRKLQNEVREFMDAHVYSAEHVYEQQLDEMENRWSVVPVMEELKAKAKSAGLWNLFLPESERGAGLTNMEYAPICEIMGRSPIGPEVFNCSAPDTGNAEILAAWLALATRRGHAAARPALEAFLGRIGRRKFLVPLYRALLEADPEAARALYARFRGQYHAVSRETLDGLLGFDLRGRTA